MVMAVILQQALAENIALRCMLGGGCDANNDGAHTTMGKGRDEFCTNCGEMTTRGKSKPWFNDARLERTMARIAASGTLLRENNVDCSRAKPSGPAPSGETPR